MDKKLKAIPGSRARVREDRPGRHVDRSGAGHDDRDDRPAASRSRSGGTGMTKDKLVAEMDKAMRDDRLRQHLGAADPRARHDADHRHPDAGRHQGQGARRRRHRGDLAADREAAARRCRAPSPCIAERISEGYYIDVQNDLERMARARRHRRRSDADRALRHRRRQHRSASSRPTAPSFR